MAPMLKTFLPYLKCVVPLFTAAFLFLGFVLAQRMIAGWIIARPIPPGGFLSIEEEIRYVNDEPATMRKHWKYKSWFVLMGAISLCMPLSIFVPNLILKMVVK